MTETKIKIKTSEVELAETLFVRDIENRVFEGIVLQCLMNIEGITLVEGNFIDSLFSRSAAENIKGIHAEQDSKHQTVSIKVEVNICYGFPIPEKAEEIQNLIAEQITQYTGLHVSCVHVVFKNVVSVEQSARYLAALKKASEGALLTEGELEEDYSENF